jgi:hypothetical protein
MIDASNNDLRVTIIGAFRITMQNGSILRF